MNSKLLIAAGDSRAEHIAACLSRLGYGVGVKAFSGAEAVAAAERDRPSLALVDLRLGGAVDGVEAGRRLSCVMDIPLIFLTDSEDPKLLERAQASEPDSYVVVPFHDQQLGFNIEAALRTRERRRASVFLSARGLEAGLRLSEISRDSDELPRRMAFMEVIFNNISDGVLVTDEQGTYVLVNAAALELTDNTGTNVRLEERSDVYGVFRPDETNPFPADELPLVRALRYHEASRDVGLFLRNARHPEGLHLSVSGTPLTDVSGKLRGAVMVYRDISDIRRTEQELRGTVERLHRQTVTLTAVLNSIREGIVVANAAGEFELWNRSADKIAGIDSLQFDPAKQKAGYGNFFADGTTPIQEHELPLMRAVRGESTDELEMFIRNERVPDGVYVSVNGGPLIDDSGTLLGGVVAFRDVTQRHHAEEALTQAFSQGRLEILDTVLHNIGNAMNSVSTGIGTIRRLGDENRPLRRLEALADSLETYRDDLAAYLADDPQGQQAIPFMRALIEEFGERDQRLQNAANRASRSANHIVDVIRTQKSYDDGSIVRKDINLRRAILDSVKVLQQSLDMRGIAIDVRCADAPEEIRVQESKFHQMLVNLIKNAMEAIDESADRAASATRGHIAIEARRERDGFLVLDVTDNGVGIEKDRLRLIFAPGYSTKAAGTGLGLHSSANFVIGSGGAIEPLSDGVGKGTTMRVRLRLAVR